MDITTNRPANANSALEARRRYCAISQAKKAVVCYKSTRTRYANRPSAENRYRLHLAENNLVWAVRHVGFGPVETPKAITERVTAALIELHDLQGAH